MIAARIRFLAAALLIGGFRLARSRPVVAGILFGLAFGMFLGAALAENKRANSTSMAGVGVILAVTGVAAARAGSSRS